MNATLIMHGRVKQANRRLYDSVAGQYEAIDGRRSPELFDWIRSRLTALSRAAGDSVLADLGSGSGVVCRAASGVFRQRIALDLSPRILSESGQVAEMKLAADIDSLPLADQSADVVTCFAVLHHLYDTTALAHEIARVLRPGGMFWSDHDMDREFYRRFRWPLMLYRKLAGADRRYTADGSGVDADTYSLAEIRQTGVHGEEFVEQLRSAGLDVVVERHWFGLTSVTNKLFGRYVWPAGLAPLLRVLARKPG